MKKIVFLILVGCAFFTGCASMNEFLGKANDVMADTNSVLSGDIDEVTEGDFNIEKIVIVSSRENDENLVYFLELATKSTDIIKPLEKAFATTISFNNGTFEVPGYAQSVRKSDLESARNTINGTYIFPKDDYGNNLGTYSITTNFDGSVLTIKGVKF